ncbi:hypothetical protein BDW66DRAFT_150964 [Aspergillus desertorum]
MTRTSPVTSPLPWPQYILLRRRSDLPIQALGAPEQASGCAQRDAKSRSNVEAYYHPSPAYHGHTNIRHSYLLDEDVTTLDTEVFGIKPVEAQSAGLTVDGLHGSDTAVYVGVMCSDYEANLISSHACFRRLAAVFLNASLRPPYSSRPGSSAWTASKSLA